MLKHINAKIAEVSCKCIHHEEHEEHEID